MPNFGDQFPFPILTEAVQRPGTPAGALGGGSAATVDAVIRNILGWRPRPDDPKGFIAALTQSFAPESSAGYTTWRWRQRGYSAMADLGAVTGAQASIYAQARVILQQALILLDGLKPLVVITVPQDIEAMKSIIRGELSELISELGIEGGPRRQRVDTLFRLLLGERLAAEQVGGQSDLLTTLGGQLKQLFDRLFIGVDTTLGDQAVPLTAPVKVAAGIPVAVNTIQDEQTFTDFILLVDYVNSLKDSWHRFRRAETPAGAGAGDSPLASRFFGTGLIQISRLLAVIAESVHEVYAAMDSVYIGPAEREVASLKFRSFGEMTIAELFGWIERFAVEEGPRLLQDAGKDGAAAFQPIISQLAGLARASLIDRGLLPTPEPNRGGQIDPASMPAGYSFDRVQLAVESLVSHLDEVDRRIITLFHEFEVTLNVKVPPGTTNPAGPANQRVIIRIFEPVLDSNSMFTKKGNAFERALDPDGTDAWKFKAMLPVGVRIVYKFARDGEKTEEVITEDRPPFIIQRTGGDGIGLGNHRVLLVPKPSGFPDQEVKKWRDS